MQSSKHQASNSNGNSNGGEWHDELDAYAQVLSSSADLDLSTNFGQGNYNERVFYDQIKNFQNAAKAMELFQRILLERAIYETKIALATDGITFYDDNGDEVTQYSPFDPDEPEHRRQEIRERGEAIWRKLENSNRVLSDKQVKAIVRKTGHDLDWQSYFAKVLVFYHESSRSVDAELIRDFLTGIKELRGDADAAVVDAVSGGGR